MRNRQIGRAEEDDGKIRQRVRDIIDGKWVTLLMTIVTLWALFGDDIRLLATSKSADLVFSISFILSLFLFILELFATSLVVDDYKYSFFFWLDCIAALSLVIDIPYLVDPIVEMFGSSSYSANVSTSTDQVDSSAQNLASELLKSFRLIRLVRIVKLYKYVTKRESGEQEQRLREAQKQAKTARQAAMNREMDPTRLGKRLSDITTKRVIIVVLLMIIILPNLQTEVQDFAPYYGLKQVFQMSIVPTGIPGDFAETIQRNEKWVVSDSGWEDLIRRYYKSSEESDGSEVLFPLLWLYVPDYKNDSRMKSIDLTEFVTDAEDDCTGFTVGDSCDLRNVEMLLVRYMPDQCDDVDCKKLAGYSRFNIKAYTQEEALISIIKTIFVGIILAAASVTFTVDTQKIVIVPITRMVLIIKNLADDPFKKPEQEEKNDEYEYKREENTGMLEDTIFRISTLLQTSFGEAGADIISKNIMSGEGELNLMRPGNKFTVIVGMIRIENFPKIAELLQEEVTIFLNTLSNIVHACCQEWNGLPLKFYKNAFLLVWKMPELAEKDTEDDDMSNPAMQRTDLANCALIAIVKIMAEVRRSKDLELYKEHFLLSQAFPEGFSVNLSACLDLGTAIEGVIGSELKVDPTYLSPHIWLANKLLDLRAEYGVCIYLTEEFYGYLSVKAKTCSRRIDTLQAPLFTNPFGLYTFDLNGRVLGAPLDHQFGQLIKLQELDSVNVESFQHKGVDFMFTLDSDLVGIQRDIPQHFFDSFRHAYVNYISGQWEEADEFLNKSLSYLQNDGPTMSIKRFIDKHGGRAPEDWNRARELA